MSLPLAAMARTVLSVPFAGPVPRLCQLVPSHLAIWFAVTPPMEVKSPPTYTSLPTTNTAKIRAFGPTANLLSQWKSPIGVTVLVGVLVRVAVGGVPVLVAVDVGHTGCVNVSLSPVLREAVRHEKLV